MVLVWVKLYYTGTTEGGFETTEQQNQSKHNQQGNGNKFLTQITIK